MGRESAIDQLNPDDKQWLDRRFMDCGFNGYEEIAAILAERGYNIGKSSIHRYGQKLENKLAAIKASTQAALLFQESVKDDGEGLNAAVLSMVQTEYFECFIALQELKEESSPEDRLALLAKVSKGVAEISKASVNQKKWEMEIREKVEAAAKAVENILKKGGLSGNAATEIRAQILGIAKK
ncbi:MULTISPECIES: DUF3486 family protein [unclassified Acinetobacter]|uniref:DUF3486 family protein n=1 Tax=unclassified Acinetobacter TaxID=196816 RepID=UPI00190A171D|nr:MULTISPECIES: DUF3486 family protein [unclassified Acinetobacter]MBK0062398.1 DUF3486 family protein [Acinetobacter sp. S55]MBK0066202.1 DUF3486 family protein [Acinetobacter sp. S54]